MGEFHRGKIGVWFFVLVGVGEEREEILLGVLDEEGLRMDGRRGRGGLLLTSSVIRGQAHGKSKREIEGEQEDAGKGDQKKHS